MLRSFSLIIVSALCLAGIAFVSSAAAQGPIDVTGDLHGAPYRIAVPATWNGTLLVYAHGYRDKADHPGEVDNRTPDIAPDAGLGAFLLGQGYALAGTAYKDNGWAVEEGMHDIKDLAEYFRHRIARPDRTIIWGFSMGSVIAFKSVEKGGELFDGALCACAVGSGATGLADSGADLLLAYDTVFGMPQSWGNFGYIRDDIDFETEVQPKLFSEVSNPANFPKFEFLRLVTGLPGRGITPPSPPDFYPTWIFLDMFFTTEALGELERRADGAVLQNLDRDYSLSADERSYLMALGVPSTVLDSWLAAMNGQRVSAPRHSREYLERNADYRGRIRRPVLTLHTLIDPLLSVSQENRYAETVANAGRSNLLFQSYTNGNGHCNFTGPQLVTAVNAINNRVTTGTPPTQANFPAGLGFLQNYSPPAPLYP